MATARQIQHTVCFKVRRARSTGRSLTPRDMRPSPAPRPRSIPKSAAVLGTAHSGRQCRVDQEQADRSGLADFEIGRRAITSSPRSTSSRQSPGWRWFSPRWAFPQRMKKASMRVGKPITGSAREGLQKMSAGDAMLARDCPGGNKSHPFRRLRRERFAAGFFCAAAALLIANSSIFRPRLSSAVSHRGLAPRPAHVSPSGPRYFGATFIPLREDRMPPLLGALPRNELSFSNFELSSCLAAATLVDSVRSILSRRSIKASTAWLCNSRPSFFPPMKPIIWL